MLTAVLLWIVRFQSLVFHSIANQVKASLEIRFATEPITGPYTSVCIHSFPSYLIFLSGERIRSFFDS